MGDDKPNCFSCLLFNLVKRLFILVLCVYINVYSVFQMKLGLLTEKFGGCYSKVFDKHTTHVIMETGN